MRSNMKKIIIFIFIFIIGKQAITAQTQLDSTSNGAQHLVLATLWFQRSAEMRATYYQAFNIATVTLEQQKKNKTKKKKAVVLDIDETVLDNSPFEGRCIAIDTPYTSSLWKEWTDLAIAEPLPGAYEFLTFAAKNGFEVFYVSNRKVTEYHTTLQNLKKVNYPFADSMHILLRSDKSSKEERRQKIQETYEIVMLVGDNLADLSVIFEDRSTNFGFDKVDQSKADFGKKYIILPNPMYGDWENELYKGVANGDHKGKAKRRLEFLKSFTPNK